MIYSMAVKILLPLKSAQTKKAKWLPTSISFSPQFLNFKIIQQTFFFFGRRRLKILLTFGSFTHIAKLPVKWLRETKKGAKGGKLEKKPKKKSTPTLVYAISRVFFADFNLRPFYLSSSHVEIFAMANTDTACICNFVSCHLYIF